MATVTAPRKSTPRKSASSSLPRSAHRRPDIEKWLDDAGVEWTFLTSVPLDQVDFEKSLRNQARFVDLDDKVVDRYAEAIKAGDKFPATVVHKPGKLYVNVDGNHRFAGYRKAGRTEAPMYVITKARPQTIALLTYEANATHGLPTSEDERVQQAIFLVDNGMPQPDAARAVSVPLKAVKLGWAKLQSNRRADEVGISRKDWDRIPQSAKNRLLNITTDEGFSAAVKLTLRAALNTEEVFELAAKVNETRSGRRQEAIVKAHEDIFAERIAETAGGRLTNGASRGRRTPRQALGMALSSLVTLPDDLSGLAKLYAPAERPEAAEKARTAADRLTKLAETLEAEE